MVRFFGMRWNAIQGLLDQYQVLRESLNQPSSVVISHHCDFIDRLQTLEGFTRCAMHRITKRIKAPAAIYEKQD
jgi:hypothetical protein